MPTESDIDGSALYRVWVRERVISAKRIQCVNREGSLFDVGNQVKIRECSFVFVNVCMSIWSYKDAGNIRAAG